MTRQRQLKSLIRSRMDRTGEKYMVARRHVLNARPSSEYQLWGGNDPETSACANAFANRGSRILSTDSRSLKRWFWVLVVASGPGTSCGSSTPRKAPIARW